LQLAKKEKQELVLKRADLISADCYDKHSKELFEDRIDGLSLTVQKLGIQKSEL